MRAHTRMCDMCSVCAHVCVGSKITSAALPLYTCMCVHGEVAQPIGSIPVLPRVRYFTCIAPFYPAV